MLDSLLQEVGDLLCLLILLSETVFSSTEIFSTEVFSIEVSQPQTLAQQQLLYPGVITILSFPALASSPSSAQVPVLLLGHPEGVLQTRQTVQDSFLSTSAAAAAWSPRRGSTLARQTAQGTDYPPSPGLYTGVWCHCHHHLHYSFASSSLPCSCSSRFLWSV